MSGIHPPSRSSLWLWMGLLLTFAFGTLWGALSVRRHMESQMAATLEARGQEVFATLESSRQISRMGRTHYFYSYTGYVDNHLFRREEQVGSDIYFLQSEGKNVQVTALRDASGQIYTHIRKNPVPYGTDLELVRLVCLVLLGVGAFSALLGLAGTLRRAHRQKSAAAAGS